MRLHKLQSASFILFITASCLIHTKGSNGSGRSGGGRTGNGRSYSQTRSSSSFHSHPSHATSSTKSTSATSHASISTEKQKSMQAPSTYAGIYKDSSPGLSIPAALLIGYFAGRMLSHSGSHYHKHVHNAESSNSEPYTPSTEEVEKENAKQWLNLIKQCMLIEENKYTYEESDNEDGIKEECSQILKWHRAQVTAKVN